MAVRDARRRLSSAFQLLRWQFWLVSVVPVLVGYHLATGELSAGRVALLVVIFGPGIEGASEAINDFYDRNFDDLRHVRHIRGVQLSGGTGLIQRGVFPAETVRRLALTLYGTAAALSLCLGSLVFTALVLAGIVSGFVYSAPPLRLKERGALGPAIIGLSFGTLTLCAGYAASGRSVSADLLLRSLPLAVIIAGHFLTHQISDFAVDSAMRSRTLGVLLGPRVTAVAATSAIMAGLVLLFIVSRYCAVNVGFAFAIALAAALVIWHLIAGSMTASIRTVAVLVQGLVSLVYLV